MKKLMIAAAIVCAATISQAASAEWDASGLAPTFTDAQIWTLDSSLMTQQAVLTAFLDGDISAITSVATACEEGYFDSGIAYMTVEGLDKGQDVNQYIIVFDNPTLASAESLYISQLDGQGRKITSGGGSPLPYEGALQGLSNNYTGDTFQGAGWYAVPEPTSGLLLLLGVAGLALRRRRA